MNTRFQAGWVTSLSSNFGIDAGVSIHRSQVGG